MSSDVQNFYAGKTIFITGACGFLGQVLLSKLLCSCPELRRIYVLIREKNGRLVDQRMKEIWNDPIFDRAKELHPNYETLVKPLQGNFDTNDISISDSDREIIENEVEIIFHVAATVKFNTPLREAAYTNVRSVDILLDVAKNTVNLKAFAYVSTAFSPSHQARLIEEKFYDPPFSSDTLLPFVEQVDDAVLDEISPSLIKPIPNMYLFTKSIAEDLCRQKGSGLPLCIFRPAIVTSCHKEPVPGWINNTNGPIGVAYSEALGIIKFAPGIGTKRASIVPGDYVVNALILSAYFTSSLWENRSKEMKFDIPVINYSSCTTKFSMNWKRFFDEFDVALEKYPFYKMVTLPSLRIISNSKLYEFLFFVFHWFPAVVLDSIFVIVGKTPQFRKLYKKIHELLELLTPFSTQEWTVSCHNIRKVLTQLSEKDREIFYCDLNDLNVVQYFENLARGVRLYVAKDTEATLQKAKAKRKRLLVLYYVFIAIVILIFLYLMTMVQFNLISLF